MRDVFAAWVLCGLVALGALFLAQTADSHRSASVVYEEMHIPGKGPVVDVQLSIADEFADATEREDLVGGDGEDKEIARLAMSHAPAPRHCWIDNFLRRLHGAG